MNHPASQNIDGVWLLIRAELDGEQAPEMVTTKTELTLSGSEYIVVFAGEISDRGSFTIDASATPKRLVLRGTEGPNEGRIIHCIYQAVGERLRICYALDGATPVEFATGAGQQRYLATYRRKPPEAQ